MFKNKVLSIVLGLALAAGILTGCNTSSPTSNNGKLVDGVYKVEYDNFDSHGYKGQLELTINGGKITEVKYDELKNDGTFKSKDEAYKKSMEEQSKTYPEKAYSELKQQLLSKQTSNIDGVTGATASSSNFKTLVKYALESMANTGKTTSAKIPAAK
ncbi:FMN-binding protein [Candidatus Clostridium radicumherbarum]|uniref:FMN-binding protein n=1 Tax=Candidatus Clostridium radicumherbarum TaxID=3381662 RepID=A0ABW8TNK1_9CLOT